MFQTASLPTTCGVAELARVRESGDDPNSGEFSYRQDWLPRPLRGRTATIAAVIIWVLGVVVGSLHSFQYETTAGKTAPARNRWPANSLCTLSSQVPTLVMFVHPRCPCSRASLNELALLMTHCQGRVDAQVVFIQPESSPTDWARTDLWDSAAGIPGVTPRVDLGGAEQQRFDARVSGEVFLYLPGGELSFHGGITASRGHAGDNDGRATLESFLLKRELPVTATPVFGCELISAGSLTQKCGPVDDSSTDQ